MSEEQAVTELLLERVILWQDHAHPNGYRPTLELLTFIDGRKALRLSVHGKVTTVAYTRPECRSCEASQ